MKVFFITGRQAVVHGGWPRDLQLFTVDVGTLEDRAALGVLELAEPSHTCVVHGPTQLLVEVDVERVFGCVGPLCTSVAHYR